MTEIELNNEYFEWMCQLVCNERYSRRLSYQKLLRHLHNIDFQYMLPMDGNRAEDGIDLRYRFGYEKEYEGPMIASYLDNRPCSVLEMLIALAFRCEEHMLKVPNWLALPLVLRRTSLKRSKSMALRQPLRLRISLLL